MSNICLFFCIEISLFVLCRIQKGTVGGWWHKQVNEQKARYMDKGKEPCGRPKCQPGDSTITGSNNVMHHIRGSENRKLKDGIHPCITLQAYDYHGMKVYAIINLFNFQVWQDSSFVLPVKIWSLYIFWLIHVFHSILALFITNEYETLSSHSSAMIYSGLDSQVHSTAKRKSMCTTI